MDVQRRAWLKRLFAAASLSSLRETVEGAVEELGFQYYLYRGHFPRPSSRPGAISIDNYLDSWRRHCLKRGIDDKFEPLRRRAQKQTTPVLWRELGQRHQAMFAEARAFGLVTGVTQLVHGPDGQWSSVNFIKSRGGRSAENQILAVLPDCQLLTCYMHDAARRILKHKSTALPKTGLSRTWGLSARERECLMLAATGKTTS